MIFNKFVKEQTSEEEKSAAGELFKPIKELCQSGSLEKEDGSSKKLRAEDIFISFVSKIIDLNPRMVEDHL